MIIIDNFLEGSLLEEIRQDHLWNGNLSSKWIDKNSPAVDTYTKVGNYIWYDKIVADYYHVGYEYWTQVISNRSLDRHYDKDEYLYETQKIIKNPIVGSIYYAHEDPIPGEEEPVIGGYLEILDSRGEIERIKPVSNRLIIFDTKLLHGVTEATGTTRRSLLTNIWETKPLDGNFLY